MHSKQCEEFTNIISNIIMAEVFQECSMEFTQTVLEIPADRKVAHCIPAKEVTQAKISGKIIIHCGTGQEQLCLPGAQDWVPGLVLRDKAESYFGTEQKDPDSHDRGHYLTVPKTSTYSMIYKLHKHCLLEIPTRQYLIWHHQIYFYET